MIGQNSTLPCAFSDKLPAMSSANQNKILRQHLNIIHKARETFIKNENSEKVSWALRHNVHMSNANIFVSGDSVYKRSWGHHWKGHSASPSTDSSIANHNPAIFSVPPGPEKLIKSPQADKKHWQFQHVHAFNNNTFADFRPANKHKLISSYVVQVI